VIALLIRFWWAPVTLALVLAVGAQQLRVSHAQNQFAEYKTEQAELTRQAEADAREREISLQEKADQTEEAKNEQIRIIGDQLDTALASLSKRPNRPAGNVPKNSGACKGATGADLSRPDAEFLTRESARADRLRSALDACYQAYEALRN
jgi:hypothetical protein